MTNKTMGKELAVGFADRSNLVNPLRGETLSFIKSWGDFSMQAKRGEFYTFQLIVRPFEDVEDLRLTPTLSPCLSEYAFFSGGGVDAQGKDFLTQVRLPKGEMGVFWCGFLVPTQTAPGQYQTDWTLSNGERVLGRFSLPLLVEEQLLPRGGADDPFHHSRLRWLNSRAGQERTVTAPYTPVSREGRRLSVLGREVTLDGIGLPVQIGSYFRRDNSVLASDHPLTLLERPVAFSMKDVSGGPLQTKLTFTEEVCDRIRWKATASYPDRELCVYGALEYDGSLFYRVELHAKTAFSTSVTLTVPFARGRARYMLGLGYEGGALPERWDWKWDEEKRQDSVFVGDVNAGLQLQLLDGQYHAPHVNIYYHNDPLRLPPCWHSGGAGGINLVSDGETATLSAYTGETAFTQNACQEYRFTMLLTPVKPINWREKWDNRYYHRNFMADPFAQPADAEQALATVVNIHHGTALHPFINYPFFEQEEWKRLAGLCHEKGLKLKPYYTIRELTNHIPEALPFLTLGEEIYPKATGKTHGIPGQGETDPWIVQNMGANRVITAWKTKIAHGRFAGQTCASILVNSQSRMANFYLEGLRYLAEQMGIDGIYVDDTGMDRTAARRARRILDAAKPEALIDLHSWNHFEDEMGAGLCCNMNLYLPLFPYLNSIWFGESFCYSDTKPDYWMTAICGLMYGLPGEMLGSESNNYKGLLYGMTNRVYEREEPSPVPIWKELIGFGIRDSVLYGYWDDACPFTSDDPQAPVSVYKAEGQMLVVVASFAREALSIVIRAKDGGTHLLKASPIEGYQREACIHTGEAFRLEAGEGMLFHCAAFE